MARSPAGGSLADDAGLDLAWLCSFGSERHLGIARTITPAAAAPTADRLKCCFRFQLRWRPPGEAVRSVHGGGGVAGWDGDHG